MPPDPLGLPINVMVPRTPCHIAAYQLFLVEAHMLEPQSFEDAVFAFSDPVLEPMVKACKDIYDQLDAIECQGNRIYLDFKENVINNKDDIKFSIAAGANLTTYSVALFKGLQTKFPKKVEYQFFKARRKIQSAVFVDVIFRIVDLSTGTPTVVYFGDLSELYP